MARTRTNKAIGRGVGIGMVPTPQIKYLGGIGVFGLFLFLLQIELTLIATVISVVTFSWWGITGDDPGQFWDSLKRPHKWIQANYPQVFRTDGFPQGRALNPKEFTVRDGGRRQTLNSTEAQQKLVSYIEYQKSDIVAGSYFLQQRSQVKVVFAFDVKGLSPSMSERDARVYLDNIAEGVRSLSGVSLKMIFISESQAASVRLDRNTTETDFEFLLKESREQRFDELRSRSMLQKKTLRIYASCHTSFGVTGQPSGYLSKSLAWVFSFFQGWAPDSATLFQTLNNAFNFGFIPLREILEDKALFGLEVEPLTAQQMWEVDWAKGHRSDAPPIPQCPVIGDRAIDTSIVHTDIHPLSILFEPEAGKPSVAEASPDMMCVPSTGDYYGFIRLGRVVSYPNSDGVAKSQMLFHHNILSPISDYELVVSIEPQDSQLNDRIQMERTFNSAAGRQQRALRKGTIDVNAQAQGTEAAMAMQMIEDGNRSTYVSAGIWVRRSHPSKIKAVMDRISSLLPLRSERVAHCTEYWWNQSFPFAWESLGKKPTDRREKYFSHQLVGLLPLVKQPTLDPKGFALVAEDGSPIQFDITEGKNHLGIFATSRAGKSILLLELIQDFFFKGYPVAVFDFPRPDGTSTYTPLVNCLNSIGESAAYFNVANETVNCLEWIDEEKIRASSDGIEDFKRRMNEVIDSHIEILRLVVCQNLESSIEIQQMANLTEQAYSAFCKDPDIQARRLTAVQADFGNEARMQMPILKDFAQFAERWLSDYIEKLTIKSTITEQCASLVINQLNGLLSTRIGRAIGGHSTIDTSAQLTVISLANVNSEFETEVYAFAADALLTRKAMGSQYSAFIVDEGTILFERASFAKRAGQKAANGHKWGCHLIVAAQTVAPILASPGGDAIFANLNNQIVGWNEVSTEDELISIGFDRDILSAYLKTSAKPNGSKIRSNWYFKRGSEHVQCYHYPGRMTLAVGANDPDEELARNQYLSYYPNSIEALINFGDAHEEAKKNGTPIALPIVDIPATVS